MSFGYNTAVNIDLSARDAIHNGQVAAGMRVALIKSLFDQIYFFDVCV